jgi:(1->4)-alpha-D-glucan 1-alpha-D-glucosylmutase
VRFFNGVKGDPHSFDPLDALLAEQAYRLAEKNRHARDFTLNSLIHAIREVIACFPVYRTYLNGEGVTERDQAIIELAVTRAKRWNPARESSVFNYLRDVLLLRFPDGANEEDRQAQQAFVMKFQQCTSPVMAKSVEDTAFYRYNRLVSLNEAGGAPQRFGASLAAFHEQNRQRLRQWPFSMLATTTHDTKRSEAKMYARALTSFPRSRKSGERCYVAGARATKRRNSSSPVNRRRIVTTNTRSIRPSSAPGRSRR